MRLLFVYLHHSGLSVNKISSVNYNMHSSLLKIKNVRNIITCVTLLLGFRNSILLPCIIPQPPHLAYNVVNDNYNKVND